MSHLMQTGRISERKPHEALGRRSSHTPPNLPPRDFRFAHLTRFVGDAGLVCRADFIQFVAIFRMPKRQTTSNPVRQNRKLRLRTRHRIRSVVLSGGNLGGLEIPQPNLDRLQNGFRHNYTPSESTTPTVRRDHRRGTGCYVSHSTPLHDARITTSLFLMS